IGVSMVVLSALVFLPTGWILAIGILLVSCHNLLDPITVRGSSAWDLLWHILHQPGPVWIDSAHLVDFVYPVLPWIGLMALGYGSGSLYKSDVPAERRRRWLLAAGVCTTLLFILLRGFNLYGEPHPWRTQDSPLFSLMSFLNTTKYPPSLHFLLMTMGSALILLGALEALGNRIAKPVIVFGRVPFFFYIVHLYVIHALAMLLLLSQGHDWHEYIFSARGIISGALRDFGLRLEAVYIIWVMIVVILYPACAWYQKVREKHPAWWWLSYL
ncbi:MAG TPA: heparan-alpha-glucosaminide N-acetyltransferase domain-containing protein, partial [Anaerolineales bacterium]|nr:heparan-alpha-glucosaminide N-acetyltransferase domain-containing protein [Anaerolineales bacterium]